MFFESEVVFGRGWAYGSEFFLRKRLGKLTGWIGYTLARSERQFAEINNGKSFPASFDRTHDISIVSNYKFNKKWTFSANWVFFTGTPITVPCARYRIDGVDINLYSDRNEYRMPAYHRLDIGITYTTKKGNSWNFFLYNAYGRKNTYSILFRENEYNPNNREAVRLSLFSFLPSITYNMKF